MEIEAKFAIPNRQVMRELQRLREVAGYQLVPSGRVQVLDRYFDTAGGDLLRAGYACRLRARQGDLLVTLKALVSTSGAIHRRDEREAQLTAWSAEPADWPDGDAKALALALAQGAPLQPLIELSQTRTMARVLDEARLVGQLSLDAVRAAVGQRPALYYELEVELAEGGTEADLERLAGELAGRWRLAPEPRSKFERGLEALRSRGAPVDGRLAADERALLVGTAAREDAELARRAQVVLAWADGLPTREITTRSGLSSGRVRFWLRGFRARRMGIFEHAAAGPIPVAAETPPMPASPAVAPEAVPAAEGTPRARGARGKKRMPSVKEFALQHGVDMARAGFVAEQALFLFDALQPVHRMPGKRRRLLGQAALLHGLGRAEDPDRHFLAGRDIILAQPLHRVSTMDRLALACIVAFNRNKVKPEREPAMAALDPKLRAHVMRISALLNIAEALDFSATQSTLVESLDGIEAERCEVTVSGPFAPVDVVQAASRAELWYQVTGQELVFAVAEGKPEVEVSLAGAGAPPASKEEAAAAQASAMPEIPPIAADEPMSEAGRKVLYLHFTRMLANEAGTRSGENIEALHDMRVATRRMRAAYALFLPYFDENVLRPFGKGLRRAGRTLGAVRDLDVLLDKARAYQAEAPMSGEGTLEPLLAHWETTREVDRRRMLEYLDSGAYRDFTARFTELLTTPGAGASAAKPGDPAPVQVRHVVPGLIMARYAAVRAYEAVLPGAPLTTYHLLRIDCKRLRYALEFFRNVLGPEAPDLIKKVVGMQDLLGELQDAYVAEGLISGFLAEQRERPKKKRAGVALEGVEGYLALQRTKQQELVARFPEPWAELIGQPFRRDLGLALVAP